MPTIDIIIRNKTASAVNPPCIVCGNSDYNVKFDFDEEWQAHNNKIGVFAYNRCGEWRSENVLFEGDTCPVPALHGVRSVWIGVTAGDVRTSTPADVPCRMGATDFSDTDEPPSADVWGQILAKLDELQTDLNAVSIKVNEAVLYTGQSLSKQQKLQARKNIGATDISLGVTATVGQTIRVKAVDMAGADVVTPTIGENGNWYLGETDTGKPSRGDKGEQGPQGERGPDGKTPIKGTDYWTASDKQEIVQSVIEELPDGSEVIY